MLIVTVASLADGTNGVEGSAYVEGMDRKFEYTPAAVCPGRRYLYAAAESSRLYSFLTTL
jgi:hypothetical protein